MMEGMAQVPPRQVLWLFFDCEWVNVRLRSGLLVRLVILLATDFFAAGQSVG
jgi:hypothetical protein